MNEKHTPNMIYGISISDDKQRAFITLGYLKDGGGPLSEQAVLDALVKAGVTYGIDRSTLKRLVISPDHNRQTVIATGVLPEDGTPAQLTYLFPITTDAKPKELANGSVDFKELGIIKNVSENEALCVKTPATPGKNGVNVMGEPIAAQPGKDMPLPVGQNTILSEDGLHLLARISGQVDYLNGRVSVMKQYDIKENVDYNTGNIDFVGNVNIGGDVCTGFTVRAGGNVFIRGGIDGGTVEAKGNITVLNGIKSQPDTKITCGGDLRCKFLQNANVDADGNLETTSCINSTVRVGNTAKFYGAQAMLLGSTVTAGKQIETLNIGSKSSKVASIVEVGIDPRIAERLAKIPGEAASLDKKIYSTGRLIALFQQLDDAGRLSEEKKADMVRFAAMVKSAEQELELLTQEKEEIKERMENLGYGTVKVFGTAYAGTQIHIGSEKKILADDYQFTQFVRTQEGITVSPAQR